MRKLNVWQIICYVVVAVAVVEGGLKYTRYALDHFPGWWPYAHLLAVIVAANLFGHLKGAERRFRIPARWSITLGSLALFVGIVYPLVRYGI